MKKIGLTILATGIAFSSLPSLGFAELLPKQEVSGESVSQTSDLESVRAFIYHSREDKLQILQNLNPNTDSKEIDQLLEDYSDNHPLPQGAENFTEQELFPEINFNEIDNNVTIDINKFIEEKLVSEPQNTFEFNKDDSRTLVYINEMGQTTISSFNISQVYNSSPLVRAATKHKSGSNEMFIYNAVGKKMVRLWSSAIFDYNGKTVSASVPDGGIEKQTAGSTTTITNKAEGLVRNYSLDSGGKTYKYCEVYTRAYIESTIAFKYGNLLIKSGTFETYTGSNVDGSIFGGAVKK